MAEKRKQVCEEKQDYLPLTMMALVGVVSIVALVIMIQVAQQQKLPSSADFLATSKGTCNIDKGSSSKLIVPAGYKPILNGNEVTIISENANIAGKMMESPEPGWICGCKGSESGCTTRMVDGVLFCDGLTNGCGCAWEDKKGDYYD